MKSKLIPKKRQYKKRKKKINTPKPKKYKDQFKTVVRNYYCLDCDEKLSIERVSGRAYCKNAGCKPRKNPSFQELHPELYDRTVIRELRKYLVAKYGYWCMKCGATRRIVVDHIKPRYYGGTNDKDNVQLLCWDCNTKKRLKTVDYRPF